jgi:hypothetical protein
VVPNEVLFRTNLSVSAEGLAVMIQTKLSLPSTPLPGPTRVVNGTVREIALIFPSATASSSAVELAQSGQLPGVLWAAPLDAPATTAPTATSSSKTAIIAGSVAAAVVVLAVAVAASYRWFASDVGEVAHRRFDDSFVSSPHRAAALEEMLMRDGALNAEGDVALKKGTAPRQGGNRHSAVNRGDVEEYPPARAGEIGALPPL